MSRRPCRIWFLDAFRAQHVKEVNDLLAERRYIKIKIGGGCTPILCGLDTDLHAQMEQGLLEFESLDFDRQQEERPWKVPTRDRQSVVDDIASWWSAFDHAHVGKYSFLRNGLSNALPLQKASTDNGEVEFEETARQDGRITRLAKKFWDINNMPVERQRAMKAVYKDWKDNKLNDFDDLKRYVDDGSSGDEETWIMNSDMEMCGPDEEEDQVIYDDDLPDDEMPAEGTNIEPLPSSAAAPAAGESALVPSSQTSVKLPTGAVEYTEILMEYDKMMEMCQKINDTRGMRQIEIWKNDRFRMLRNSDPEVTKELHKHQAEVIAKREEMRKKLLQEDRERKAKKEEKKKKEEAEKKKKEKAKAEAAEQQALQLMIDRTDCIFLYFHSLY